MPAKSSFGSALRFVRQIRGLSQEAFSEISSRTYMSSLERSIKNPTLSKIDDLCDVLDVHPIALLALAYTDASPQKAKRLLAEAQQELDDLEDLERRKFPTKT